RLAFPTFGSRYGTLDLKSGTWDLEDIEPAAGFADACHHEGALFTISERGILASAVRERARRNRGSTFIVSPEGRLVCSVHSGGATGCTALRGGRFASVGRDLKLRLWGLDRSVGIATAHRNAMSCCAASADGTHLATGDEAGRVGIFDLRSGEYLRFVRL